MKKWALALIGTVLVIGIYVYNHKLFYPPLPMENVSKKDAVEKLKVTDKPIMKLSSESGYEWYITHGKQGMVAADETIKGMFSQYGWMFKEKDGAGLFFERDGEELIATTQMWTGDYVLVKIPETFNK